MVKQLGIPTFFLTLSCDELRREKLSYIINNLKSLKISGKELKKSYREWFYLLNNNPLLWHFQ